ncbi:MAG TPA: hypothetical protein VD861_00860, partial [Pyrinomonadaceae bacterium]|nr:hypothetical protein [Pyrinomonadaceae bacterium]
MTAKPRQRAPAAILLAALLLSSCLLTARAQEKTATGESERGVALYHQGDLGGAIRALAAAVKAEKRDADAWHFLGLAYYGSGDAKSARKAFEAEAKLRRNSAAAHIANAYALLMDDKYGPASLEAERALALDASAAEAYYIRAARYFKEVTGPGALDNAEKAIKLDPNFAPAHLLRAQILLGTSEWAIVYFQGESDEQRAARVREAKESMETYMKLFPLPPDRELLRETLGYLDGYLKPKTERPAAPPSADAAKESGQKARILSRPEPKFTELARQMGVSGTVILRAVFSSDGRIRHIRVMNPLPYGLTEE